MKKLLLSTIPGAVVALVVCLFFLQMQGILTQTPPINTSFPPPEFTDEPMSTDPPEETLGPRPTLPPGGNFGEFMDEQLFDDDCFILEDGLFLFNDITAYGDEGTFETIDEAYIVAYFDDQVLQIMKITYFDGDAVITIRFYLFDDYMAIIKETKMPDPFAFFDDQITAIKKMAIYENVLYYIIDDNEALFASANAAEYQNIFDAALGALNFNSVEV